MTMTTTTTEKIARAKAAILAFQFWDYGMDDVSNLAREDPDVGVFDDLARTVVEALERDDA
jgi:hypothetical protein